MKSEAMGDTSDVVKQAGPVERAGATMAMATQPATPAVRVYSLDPYVPGTIPVLTANCWDPPGAASENVLRKAETFKRAGMLDRGRRAPIYLRNFLYGNGLADSAIDWTRPVDAPLDVRSACRRAYWAGWTAMFFAAIVEQARWAEHPILLDAIAPPDQRGPDEELVIVQCENHRSPFKVPPAGVQPSDRLYRHTVQRLIDLGMEELREVIRQAAAWPASARIVAAYEMANFSAAAVDWNGWRLASCAPGEIDSPSAQIRWSAGKGDETMCTRWAIEILRACTQRRIVAWIGPGGIGERGEYWAPDWWPRALRRIVEAGREIGVKAWTLWRPNGEGQDQRITRDMAQAAAIVREVGGAA